MDAHEKNRIYDEGNIVYVDGILSESNIKHLLATMHRVVERKRFPEIILNFEECTKAFAQEMIMVCALARDYHRKKVSVYLDLPKQERMRKLFINANWAHLIDFQAFEESKSKSSLHIPATIFRNAHEHVLVVNQLTDRLMATMPTERREDLRFIQWVLNEITDNVINHSCSENGGIIQLTHHSQRKRIEITICDTGIGIPESLRSGDFPTISDPDALASVIKEGVTRSKSAGQGNGLYGTYEIASKTGGRLTIMSGKGSFSHRPVQGTRWRRETIPFNGTLVDVQIGYNNSIDVRDILVIKGKSHLPIDTLDLSYEADEAGRVNFEVANETTLGFGSRVSGKHLRNKVLFILTNDQECKVEVSFKDIDLISSSFADEFLGKLCCMIGVMKFMRRISIIAPDNLTNHLIDKAISQRMETGLDE